jgi:hypothetical protein
MCDCIYLPKDHIGQDSGHNLISIMTLFISYFAGSFILWRNGRRGAYLMGTQGTTTMRMEQYKQSTRIKYAQVIPQLFSEISILKFEITNSLALILLYLKHVQIKVQ